MGTCASPDSLKVVSFEEDPYFQEVLQPPIYSPIPEGGGVSIGGGGLAKFINPSQASILQFPVKNGPQEQLEKLMMGAGQGTMKLLSVQKSALYLDCQFN